MVMLKDLAQLYLLHVNVEPGASLSFARGTQSHYCGENLLNDNTHEPCFFAVEFFLITAGKCFPDHCSSALCSLCYFMYILYRYLAC